MPKNEFGQLLSPMGWGEVASELGAASFDEGTLCIHPNVNKWSLCKPVPDAGIEVDRNSRWYDGKRDGKPLKCGMDYGQSFTIPFSATEIDSVSYPGNVHIKGNGMFVQMANKTAGNWDYIKPSHTKGDWYRIGDFIFYQHSSINPLPYVKSAVVWLHDANTEKTKSYGDIICVVPNQVTGGITLNDLGVYNDGASYANGTSFKDMYLGVFVFNNSLTDCFWVTQDKTFGTSNNNYHIAFNDNDIPSALNRFKVNGKKGLYHCVTFFSSHPLKLCQHNFTELGVTFFVPCNNERYDIALLQYGTETRYVTLSSFKNTATSGTRVEVHIEATISNWDVNSMYVSSVKFVEVNDFGEDENEITLATGINVSAFSEVKIYKSQITNILGNKGYIKVIAGGKEYKSETLTRS